MAFRSRPVLIPCFLDLILAATLATLLFAGLMIVGAKRGLGNHIWGIVLAPDYDFQAAERIIKLNYGAYTAYAVATALTKLSIIASYLRIFPGRYFCNAMLILAGAVILQGIIGCFVVVFACSPPEGSWNWAVPRRKCLNIMMFFYVSGGINVATDFLLWGAPIPLLWKTSMTVRQRVGLCGLYAAGLV